MGERIIEMCLECGWTADGPAFFAPSTGERRLWCDDCDELTEPVATVLRTEDESTPPTSSPSITNRPSLPLHPPEAT